jgi:hypothetical protein
MANPWLGRDRTVSGIAGACLTKTHGREYVHRLAPSSFPSARALDECVATLK